MAVTLNWINGRALLLAFLCFALCIVLYVQSGDTLLGRRASSLPPIVKSITAFKDSSGSRSDRPAVASKDSSREKCNDLCTVDAGQFSKGKFFKHRKVNVECNVLFSDSLWPSTGHGLVSSPKKIPSNLRSGYSMNGKVKIGTLYLNQTYFGKTALASLWSVAYVVGMMDQAKKGELFGNYGATETNGLRACLKQAPGVRNGRVLVIGSEIPWVEACVLEAGAAKIVTLEYGKITSLHPQISTMVPSEYKAAYKNDSLGLFDAIVTFSSVEHSGLGRYGDRLNPWSDVLEIARAWCVCKEGGSLVIGIPQGTDAVIFNAHRHYGSIRWPYLATNWVQHSKGPHTSQQVHVFTKERQNTAN